ncbi:MAG TPA: alpha/beta fold hydrolase [Solirubrobacterales bacterium]|jgi:pimeloyl-ACP methyl ester carboxylesterase|nr:alpha/beta fold hydrolase [Solirubrobacterales bacterium]
MSAISGEPAPFRRGSFDELPERPRLPHPFGEAPKQEVVVESTAFGAVQTRVVTYGRETTPPLLLVHGLMTSSYSWRYLLEPLGSRYRLYIPDLPGWGESQPLPPRRHSGLALASFIGDLQASSGSRAATPSATRSAATSACSERSRHRSFGRLVVVHAPALPQARLRALHLALKAPGTARALSHVVRRDPLRWAHRNVHYYDESLKSLEEARAYGEPLATKAGAGAFIRYLADALNPAELTSFVNELERRRDRGQGFPVPLMLVYARQDPMVPPEIGPKLHQLVLEAEFHGSRTAPTSPRSTARLSSRSWSPASCRRAIRQLRSSAGGDRG